MSPLTESIMKALHRNLQSIWDGDLDTYRETTADDVSFYEWYISPQRIDGIDFHLRELSVHGAVLSGEACSWGNQRRIEHEILQPRIQVYDSIAIITYTLLIRAIDADRRVSHRSHHETRVFHNTGSAEAPRWKLVHCHKSPIVTAMSMAVVRS